MDYSNNSPLNGKRILLLAPSVFGYQVEIASELTKLGATVTYFDERPGNDFFSKASLRLGLNFFINRKVNSHYEIIKHSVEVNAYDFLFVINPEAITFWFLDYVKKSTKIKIYFYIWDSIKNKKNAINMIPYSDRFITFDPADSVDIERVSFLPLFYINDYKDIAYNDAPEYDMSFIGTIHSDRLSVVASLKKLLKSTGKTFYIYYYSPSIILFIFKKFFGSGYKYISKADVNFEYLRKDSVLAIFKNSKVILDVEHPNQSGLTMRTIESLGAKRKLVTTNKNVKLYDFYNDNNVCIVDRSSIEVDPGFFSSPYQDVDEGIYIKYSLTNWLLAIFDESRS